MPQGDLRVESNTLHDDAYLSYHKIFETNTNFTSNCKINESAGGYSYLNDDDYRLIIWRTSANRLDLIEQSLVYKLNGNAKSIYFSNAIIPTPFIQSNGTFLEILISTTSSFYKFRIPLTNNKRNSILHNVSRDDLFDNEAYSFKIDSHTVDSCCNFISSTNGDTWFSHLTPQSSLCLYKFTNRLDIPPLKIEVNSANNAKKLWSKITRNNQDSQSNIVSYKLIQVNDTAYAVCLCEDYKLKIWNLKTNDLMIEDLFKNRNKVLETTNWDECKLNMIKNTSTNFKAIFVMRTNETLRVLDYSMDFKSNDCTIVYQSHRDINMPGQLVGTYVCESNVWLMNKSQRDEFEISFLNIKDQSVNELILQRPLDKDDDIIVLKDMKETFMRMIFEPFRFSKATICKSLRILRQSKLRENEIPESNEELKEILLQSIENEVQNYPNIQNVTEEEEFLEINFKCWTKFYSMLVQYDYDACSPIGLFCDEKYQITLLIKKNGISLFSKADLSHVYDISHSIGDDLIKSCISKVTTINDTDTMNKDLNRLFTVVKSINSYVQDKKNNFQLEEPSTFYFNSSFINTLGDRMNSNHQSLIEMVCTHVKKLRNFKTLEQVFDVLFSYFDSSNYVANILENDEMDLDEESSVDYIESELTLNYLISSYRQLIHKRFEFLRNCLLLVKIIETSDDLQDFMNSKLKSNILPKLEAFVKSYEYLKWIGDLYPHEVNQSLYENNLKRLFDFLDNNHQSQLNSYNFNNLMLKSYLIDVDKSLVRASLLSYSSNNWIGDLVNGVIQILLPMSANYNFIKYLMYNNQYTHVSNYCFATKWFKDGEDMRNFLMGHSCLSSNEIDKSIEFFFKASLNLEDDFVLKRFLQRESIDQQTNLKLNYYTKVIQYYSQNGSIDAIIELINRAIPSCADDTGRTKLYCILFKSFLDLEYYEQAYEALIKNKDLEWKYNCLKELIIELCNKNRPDILTKFDFATMQKFVKDILHRRAQESDIRTQDYYSVLFVLYLKNQDYRRAAATMYEHAIRLKRELNGIFSLEKQEKCLLAALNVLKLIPVHYRWICVDEQVSAPYFEFSVTHQKSNDKNIAHQECIIEYDDINKMYLIVHYLVKISKMSLNQSKIGNQYTVEQLASLLVNQGLFDDAITLTLTFKKVDSSPLVSILNSLVDKCCEVIGDQNKIEDWLKFNESLPVSTVASDNQSNMKWKLLHIYLERYNDKIYYKSVCNRILTLGYEIPNYIVISFQKLDTASLLRLYISYGLIEQACDLCIDYIDSLFNNDSLDQLNESKSSTLYGHNCKTLLLPYSSIDQLLHALDDNKQDKKMQELNTRLQEKLASYFEIVKAISLPKLNKTNLRMM